MLHVFYILWAINNYNLDELLELQIPLEFKDSLPTP